MSSSSWVRFPSRAAFFGAALALCIAAALTVASCASPWPKDSADLEAQDSPTALRIRSALIEEPRLDGAAIDVVFAEGRATLTGFVETRQQRRLAAELARQQKGVTRVVNEIEVK